MRIPEVQPERVHVLDGLQKRDRLRVVLFYVLVDEPGEREFFKLSSFLESIPMSEMEGAMGEKAGENV